jgi:hypothetical protein
VFVQEQTSHKYHCTLAESELLEKQTWEYKQKLDLTCLTFVELYSNHFLDINPQNTSSPKETFGRNNKHLTSPVSRNLIVMR